ncbi:MAG: BrnA antitoxin family protein [Bryocella sp.]
MKRTYKHVSGTPMTDEQRRELELLMQKPDHEIDVSDAPVLPASVWKNAVRGKFYRPVKKPLSLRLDADVIEWLKKDGRGYQTRANQMLRERMLQDLAVVRKKKAA